MSEEKAVNYSEIFNMFDTDGSAVLSDREIRYNLFILVS